MGKAVVCYPCKTTYPVNDDIAHDAVINDGFWSRNHVHPFGCDGGCGKVLQPREAVLVRIRCSLTPKQADALGMPGALYWDATVCSNECATKLHNEFNIAVGGEQPAQP